MPSSRPDTGREAQVAWTVMPPECGPQSARGAGAPNALLSRGLRRGGWGGGGARLGLNPRADPGVWVTGLGVHTALALVFQLGVPASVGESLLPPHPAWLQRGACGVGRGPRSCSRPAQFVFPALQAGVGATPAGGALSPLWWGVSSPRRVAGCDVPQAFVAPATPPVVVSLPSKNSRKTAFCQETLLPGQDIWIWGAA